MVGGIGNAHDGGGAAYDAKTVVTLFMAAVAGEVIKGFHVGTRLAGFFGKLGRTLNWS